MANAYLDLLAYFGIGGAHPGGFDLTQSILGDENIQRTESVLDIGCGTGQTAAFLAEKFDCQVTAVDNHPIMIEKAKQRFANTNFNVSVVEGDVPRLDFVDNSFDLILAESVIAFTSISKTLNELARVLKSDGRMIMIEMTAEQSLSEELKEKIRDLYGIHEILTEVQWKSKLQEAGFNQVHIINTPSELTPSEINDINQSENIQMDLFDLLDKHNHFLRQYGHLTGYRVFRCQLH